MCYITTTAAFKLTAKTPFLPTHMKSGNRFNLHARMAEGKIRPWQDTAVAGELVRNLTTWADVDASRVVFTVGNCLFASAFLGKTAIMFLWIAFLAAFLTPVARSGQLQEWCQDTSATVSRMTKRMLEAVKDLRVRELIAMAKERVSSAIANVRERVGAARGGGSGGMEEGAH